MSDDVLKTAVLTDEELAELKTNLLRQFNDNKSTSSNEGRHSLSHLVNALLNVSDRAEHRLYLREQEKIGAQNISEFHQGINAPVTTQSGLPLRKPS